MKYGEALPQRSVLEWRAFNLDYNEICNLIKKHTIGRIPVSNPNSKTEFDDELFNVLLEQLERIELFVKSKAGEIDRRIAQCQKAIAMLYEKDKSNTLSSKRLARYVKAEAEVERALYETQNLSRFTKAQYTGFKKLLKKYKKWTGSTCVVDRFTLILEPATTFHSRDFEGNVLVLSELLTAVRAKYNELIDASQNRKSVQISPNTQMTGAALSNLLPEGHCLRTHADIDMALGTNSPENPSFTSGKGGKAVYWVHSDHLVEIQVLLLKYLNLQSSTPIPTLPPTPAQSRRPSTTGLNSLTWASEKVESVGAVILDNLPKFAQAQSSKTIEQASEMGPAAKIRWCGNDKDADASIIVSPTTDIGDLVDSEENGHYTLRLKRKHVEKLINITAPLIYKEYASSVKRIRQWFEDHPTVAPLAKILARRTRFVSGYKIWATLDRDIKMFRLGEDWEGCISDPSREETGVPTVFPHAVLEVRWEGHEVPAVVQELNKSHLVEAVPGFSLDVHAVAVLHEPKEMATPFWLPALSRDIRKTPPRPLRHSRQPSSITIPHASSGPSVTSTAAFDYTDAELDSSGTLVTPPNEYTDNQSIGKKKSLSWRNQRKPPHSIEHSWLGGERYWSEFNDENDDEPYTILIHPQPADSEPTGCLGKFSEDLKRFFNFHEETGPNERTSLLAPDFSDDDVEAAHGEAWRYATFASQQEQLRERRLFRGYCLFFAASILILTAAGAWAFTHSPKKREGQNMNTSVTETLAVFGAAVLAGYAVSLFIARKSQVSMFHKSIVLGLFCLICLVGSLILSIVYNNWLRP
ncbi:VTC domain-containing protein [Terfezia claveryi]|nr:VTC domain-containing protein [Terfezia claveryi]